MKKLIIVLVLAAGAYFLLKQKKDADGNKTGSVAGSLFTTLKSGVYTPPATSTSTSDGTTSDSTSTSTTSDSTATTTTVTTSASGRRSTGDSFSSVNNRKSAFV